MRILLPPSEGKTPASPDRAPIRLESLVYPHLADQRLAVGGCLPAPRPRAPAGGSSRSAAGYTGPR